MPQPNMNQEPLTVAYIRNELRNNRYTGDLFTALRFMLDEYDMVSQMLRVYTKPTEYNVKRIDVV